MSGVGQERLIALVVDDFEDGRFLLKKIMEGMGFNVAEAANGEEAVEQVRRECPTLILMDLNMPRMDGLEAARKIRACKELCHDVPIVAVTAYNTYGMKEAAEEAGCDAYVAKPIDMGEFDRTVRRVLRMW